MEKIIQEVTTIFHETSSWIAEQTTMFFTFAITTSTQAAVSGSWWLYVAILLVAFFESTPLFGIIVPGGILMIVAGFFARMDLLSFWATVGLAAVGGVLGDSLAYYAGKKLGPQWLAKKKRFARIISFDRGATYFLNHGNKSVFLARFVGPVRPIIPFTAGLYHMKRSSFLFYNLAGGIVWALVYVSFGYFFGASWELAERWAGVLGFIVVATLIIWLFFAFIWKALAKQRKMIVRLIKEIIRSTTLAIKSNEDIKKWLAAHPQFSAWCSMRLSKTNPFGRHVTYGAIVVMYCLWHTTTIPWSVLTSGALLQVDVHFARLMVQLNDSTVGAFMFLITELGSLPVVVSMTALLTLVLVLYGKRREALLGLSLMSTTGLMVYLGKFIIQRPRPDLAPLIIESSFSLPSGHAAGALALYGWMAYLVMHSTLAKKTRRTIIGILLTLIALIGASRIYLGVHWVSDVLAGYALSGAILAAVITLAEIFNHLTTTKKTITHNKKITRRIGALTALGVLEIAIIIGVYVTQVPIIKPPLPDASIRMVSEEELLSYVQKDMPKQTQTLSGRPQEPVSFIIVGTREQVIQAFNRSDWTIADPINGQSLYKVAWAVIKNDSYPTAPVTPVFYNGYPQDFAVQKETEKGSARQRHHARFWKTGVQLNDGRTVWVGTASYDVGIKRFYTHRIDPAIDTERDFMHDELLKTNTFEEDRTIQITQRILGRNFTGDLFFTDGMAHLMVLPLQPAQF